ncbi:MAG: hypothetical protein JWR67_1072 [Mucilaginibacter sp.]|nr:hypothetical protein [Mucilaginibacter sp.]
MKKSFKNCFHPVIGVGVFMVCFFAAITVKAADRYYYEIKVYHLKTSAQEERVDHYLQNAYLPALHKIGVKNVGVFKPVTVDTADRKIYVFIPFSTWDKLENADQKLMKDEQYLSDGKDYLDALYNNQPYTRIETIILKAFPNMIAPALPNLTGNKADRVYELRSYESATEKYHINKVKMFNEGGEIPLFKRLNFNAVFYADVIAGSRMPNLMYMTTFNNKQDRDDHWKAFSADAEWKQLSGRPEYQHNVQKNDDVFLHPVSYSDF